MTLERFTELWNEAGLHIECSGNSPALDEALIAAAHGDFSHFDAIDAQLAKYEN